jgi:hypothetical protein
VIAATSAMRPGKCSLVTGGAGFLPSPRSVANCVVQALLGRDLAIHGDGMVTAPEIDNGAREYAIVRRGSYAARMVICRPQ